MTNVSTAAPTQPVTPPSHPIVLPSLPSSASLLYFVYDGKEIDDTLLDRCARLFGENYGIWGTNPTAMKAPKAGSLTPFLHLLNKTNQNSGSRVKMSGARLRKQCVAVPNSTVVVVCYQPTQGHHESDGLELVGHAFATVWDYDNGTCLPSMVNSQC
jgi:hypothetical protein